MSWLSSAPVEFDGNCAVLTFGTWYEAEMAKLPHDADDVSRGARHRELVGLGPVIARAEWVDVVAIMDGAA